MGGWPALAHRVQQIDSFGGAVESGAGGPGLPRSLLLLLLLLLILPALPCIQWLSLTGKSEGERKREGERD